MAAVTIPAGAVTCRDGDPIDTRKAQAAIAAGDVVFVDSANANKFNVADKNTEAAAAAVGIAVGDAAAGEYVTVATSGSRITVASAAFTKGVPYFVGDTGDIIPEADIAGADYATYLGIAISTTVLELKIHVSGVTQ